MRIVSEFKELDLLVKAGQANKAAVRLTMMLKDDANLGRADRLILAKLARRAFAPQLGIKLLRPMVRPSEKKPIVATGEEKTEYAANLSWLGAVTECHSLLDQVDSTLVPEALFIRALALFSEWRYREAIPYLHKYILHSDVADYWKNIGRLNLMAALAHEGQSVEELRNHLEEVSLRENLRLVLGNVYLFQTESLVQRQEFEKATQTIKKAHGQLEAGGMNSLFLDKWSAVISLHHDQQRGLEELGLVRQKAVEVSHWETLRDCDLQEIRVTQDLKKGEHLYFGTPHSAYREHLLSLCPWVKNVVGSHYDRSFSEKKISLPIVPWELTREGHVLGKLWEVLQSDFYSPLSLGYLQSKVFPWKQLNFDRGANSLHQALKRLRHLFEEQKIPLHIQESKSEYQLQAKSAVTVRVRMTNLDNPKVYPEVFRKLEKSFPQQSFRASHVSEVLSLSRNMSLNYLRVWQTQGFIEKTGSGPQTTYRVLGVKQRPKISDNSR